MKGATGAQQQKVINDVVSIHAPNEGSDTVEYIKGYNLYKFQSTLPMKGATRVNALLAAAYACFNPRSQ